MVMDAEHRLTRPISSFFASNSTRKSSLRRSNVLSGASLKRLSGCWHCHCWLWPPLRCAPSRARAPLYYQDAGGKPYYSAGPEEDTGRPRLCARLRRSAQRRAPRQRARAETKRRILYYRNPMGLPDTSPVPKKDSMGMDYIPVYADEAERAAARSASRRAACRLLGVRTEQRSNSALPSPRTVRATGTLAFDERRLAIVTTKVEGWIEHLDCRRDRRSGKTRPGAGLRSTPRSWSAPKKNICVAARMAAA